MMQATFDRRFVQAVGLAAGLALTAPLAHAAQVGGGVRTFALDYPHVLDSDEDTAGGNSNSPPVVSYAVDSLAGDSMAHAQISVDGYTGAMRAKFSAQVGATDYLAGRGATASGTAGLTGSIGILGSGSPVLATFGGVLEGAYSADPLSLNSSISLDYSFLVGASPDFRGRVDYSRATGTFSIPFTWTQTVQAGDRIDFLLYLHGSATAGFGLAELDALNTFEITTIDLPPGYSFTPDADGFLSQFDASAPTAPVPEPATAGLIGIGLIAIVIAWTRRRSGLIRGPVLLAAPPNYCL